MLEILDLGKRGIQLYYLCSEYKDADQLHGYRAIDLRLCFLICKNCVCSCEACNGKRFFKDFRPDTNKLATLQSNLG